MGINCSISPFFSPLPPSLLIRHFDFLYSCRLSCPAPRLSGQLVKQLSRNNQPLSLTWCPRGRHCKGRCMGAEGISLVYMRKCRGKVSHPVIWIQDHGIDSSSSVFCNWLLYPAPLFQHVCTLNVHSIGTLPTQTILDASHHIILTDSPTRKHWEFSLQQH